MRGRVGKRRGRGLGERGYGQARAACGRRRCHRDLRAWSVGPVGLGSSSLGGDAGAASHRQQTDPLKRCQFRFI